MPFGMKTRVGLRNHVLDGSGDPPMGRGSFPKLPGPFKFGAALVPPLQPHSQQKASFSMPGKHKQECGKF